MTPWTALLESFHSALVDELTERHPEPKPGLGMPKRAKEWLSPWGSTAPSASPAAARERSGFADVELTQGKGMILLCMDSSALQDLGTSVQPLWSALLRRVGAELSRRNLQPRFSAFGSFDPDSLPKTFDQIDRMVWIPFHLGNGTLHLGMALLGD